MLAELFRTQEHWIDLFVFSDPALAHRTDFTQPYDSLDADISLLGLFVHTILFLDAQRVSLSFGTGRFFLFFAVCVCLCDSVLVFEHDHPNTVCLGTRGLVHTEPRGQSIVLPTPRALAEIQ